MRIKQFNETVFRLQQLIGFQNLKEDQSKSNKSQKGKEPADNKRLNELLVYAEGNPEDNTIDLGTEYNSMFAGLIEHCLVNNDAWLLQRMMEIHQANLPAGQPLTTVACCVSIPGVSLSRVLALFDNSIIQKQFDFLDSIKQNLKSMDESSISPEWAKQPAQHFSAEYSRLINIYPPDLLDARQAQFRAFVIANLGLSMIEAIGDLKYNDNEFKKLMLRSIQRVKSQIQNDTKINRILTELEDKIRAAKNIKDCLKELESAKEALLVRRATGLLGLGLLNQWNTTDRQVASDIDRLALVISGIRLKPKEGFESIRSEVLEEDLIDRIHHLRSITNNSFLQTETNDLAATIRKFATTPGTDITAVKMAMCQWATLELMYKVDNLGYTDHELIVFIKAALERIFNSDERFYNDLKIRKFLQDLNTAITQEKTALKCILYISNTIHQLQQTSKLAQMKLGPNHSLLELLNKLVEVLELINPENYYLLRSENTQLAKNTDNKLNILMNDIKTFCNDSTPSPGTIRIDETKKTAQRVQKLYQQLRESQRSHPQDGKIADQINSLRRVVLDYSSSKMFRAIGDLDYTEAEVAEFLKKQIDVIAKNTNQPNIKIMLNKLSENIGQEQSLLNIMLAALRTRNNLQKLGLENTAHLLYQLEKATDKIAVVKAIENKIIIFDEVPKRGMFGL